MANTTLSPDLAATARKYTVSEETATAPTPVQRGTNNDSIVTVAAGLRSLAMNISALAQQSQQDVQATRDAIESAVTSNISSSSPTRHMTEDDVVQSQQRLTNFASAYLPTLNSRNLNLKLKSGLSELVDSSRHTFMPIVKPGLIDVENRVTPDIDQVSLELKRNRSISDAFAARVTFSVPVDDIDSGEVKSLRVFRADVINPNFARPLSTLSLRGMGILTSLPLSYRSKNDDTVSMFEHRLNSDEISNELTELNPFDRFTKNRVVASSGSFDGVNVDPAVADNIRFIEARRLQNPNYNTYQLENAVVVGKTGQTNAQLGGAHSKDLGNKASTFQFTLNRNNGANFKQIFAATPSDFAAKRIGDRYYYTYDDTSVVFGRRYQYYVVTVNKNMVQSNRSPITTIDVDGLRVPPSPKNVVVRTVRDVVTLVVSVEDQLVEKFEIWKSSDLPMREATIATLDTGFSLVAETTLSEHESGANWIDKNVIPGRNYRYRIYSVDVFGNKSEVPHEVHVTVPQRADTIDPTLRTPSVLAEVDSKTQKVKITVYCQDQNVKKIRLERRDLSIDQQNFTVPTESGRTVLGQTPLKHSSFQRGEKLFDLDNNSVWTGYFENTGKIDFVDRLVSFDRVYQYRVYGVGVAGNRTSYDYSRPVLVYRRPMINTPVNFSSSFTTGTNGEILGVQLSWNSSSLDISAEDRFGSQFVLNDTSVRTLYQLERQKEGGRWLKFNLVDGNGYFDPVATSSSQTPGYRPPYLELNSNYEYRLQAVLSGGYISNKTDQLSVFVANNIKPPENFNLRTPDSHVRPLYIMLNWGTNQFSGPVDHWTIERSEVNNYAAARINVKNTDDFKKLTFETFRTVYRESSRFRSYASDDPTSTNIINAEHHFLDAQVSMGNTYFYKLTAVDTQGNTSSPVYRGMKLTNASHERLMDAILSQAERDELTQNFIPARVATSVTPESPKNSMGLNPGFSSPKTTLQITRIDKP